MNFKIYQVDAFTDSLFGGNPAAIVLLEKWLPEETMQNIALENNLSETAFIVPQVGDFDFYIRWFTPTVEIDLCGHATLASAHIIFSELDFTKNIIAFNSKSGMLTVTKSEDVLTLDFPAEEASRVESSPEYGIALGSEPLECYRGKSDLMFVLESEAKVRSLNPNLLLLKELPARGIIVTAKGENVDFVSRFFAPASGINEDPVTGSAHTTLAPFWGKRLGKSKLLALQLSSRLGKLTCETKGERVLIAGKAKLYLKGEIFINER